MLTSTLPRWEGDSEPRFVLDLARHLSDEIDVEILAPHATGAARREVLDGIPVTRFRYWIPWWQSVAYEGGISWRLKENRWRLFQVPFFMLSLAWHTVRRLRRGPPVDIVHAHWIVPQGLVAVLVRGLAGRRVRVVCTSHGGDLFGLRGKAWTAIKRWVLRRCDAVTVVSNAMADRVREIAPNVEPEVIPMGTDLRSLFTPPEEPRQPPFNRLIFVGRLVEKKGVKYLLEAMALVRKTHLDVTLDIVGHGPLRAELEAQARALGLEDCVRFVGAVPHAELPDYYRAADIAVFPFVEAESGDQEGFGLVMVEAMGCGCTVIASELPAVRDVILHEQTGISTPARGAKTLADALTQLLAESDGFPDIAKRGVAHAQRRFDWSVTAARFVEAMRAVAQRDRTAPSPSRRAEL
ncbi:glycosyltransferase family 4 protein [Thioalkalivibrio sp. XN279]|nr:glycosyltransferase [Thioalkalivibrio sp. XN279]NHA16059.1 glycosyltransferase family 4 protein [Thioalkalivibrio sp. XN279]